MKRKTQNLLDLPLGERAIMALRAAVRKAKAEHQRCGVPFYVLQDGKVVDLLAVEARRRKNLNRKRTARTRNSR
jgi:hypothetical protein